MVWKEVDEGIEELERDFVGLLQDIESKDLISKETLNLQEENAKLLKQIENLHKENDILTAELNKEIKLHDNLKKNFDMLQKTIYDKEVTCMNFQNGLEINERDSLRLKKAKEQYLIGKDFTGIRWDYSAPKNICKGYIVNKTNKTIDTFEMDKGKYSEEKIQKFLWSLIEQHSDINWSDLVSACTGVEANENKENKEFNN